MNNISERVYDYCVSHLRKIPESDFKYGDYSFDNQRCHHNAVAAARAGRADAVYLVIAGHKSHMVVHFINKKDGKFFDETWHEYDSNNEYYIIRKIDDSEYSEISSVLMATKRLMVNMFGGTFDKIKMNYRNEYTI